MIMGTRSNDNPHKPVLSLSDANDSSGWSYTETAVAGVSVLTQLNGGLLCKSI